MKQFEFCKLIFAPRKCLSAAHELSYKASQFFAGNSSLNAVVGQTFVNVNLSEIVIFSTRLMLTTLNSVMYLSSSEIYFAGLLRKPNIRYVNFAALYK